MVGWLLASGASSSHEQTSTCDATNDRSRSRTGSDRAPSTRASSIDSSSERGASTTEEQHHSSLTMACGAFVLAFVTCSPLKLTLMIVNLRIILGGRTAPVRSLSE